MTGVFTEAGRIKAERTGALTGPSVLETDGWMIQFNWDRRMIEMGQMDGSIHLGQVDGRTAGFCFPSFNQLTTQRVS